MTSRDLSIDGLRAHLTQPDAPSRGGVLVLPTILGIEEHMHTVCGWLNAAGLTALVWDPFSAYPADMPVEQRWPIGKNTLGDRPALQEQRRWVAYMHDELGLANVGALGFCLGGRMVFTLAAAEPRLQAGVAYHPSVELPPPAHHLDAAAAARDVGCPIQVLYPGHDHITKGDTFRTLRQALEASRQPTSIHVYPEAEHGFTEGYSIVSKVDRGAKPANQQAKALAWPQTVAFFNACLS